MNATYAEMPAKIKKNDPELLIIFLSPIPKKAKAELTGYVGWKTTLLAITSSPCRISIYAKAIQTSKNRNKFTGKVMLTKAESTII